LIITLFVFDYSGKVGGVILKQEMRKCIRNLDKKLRRILKKSDDDFERIDKNIDRKTKVVLLKLGDVL